MEEVVQRARVRVVTGWRMVEVGSVSVVEWLAETEGPGANALSLVRLAHASPESHIAVRRGSLGKCRSLC